MIGENELKEFAGIVAIQVLGESEFWESMHEWVGGERAREVAREILHRLNKEWTLSEKLIGLYLALLTELGILVIRAIKAEAVLNGANEFV